MSTPMNELDALLMASLKQLSDDFQLREERLTKHYESSVRQFKEQSSELARQYEAVSNRLNKLMKHYEDNQALMQRISQQLNALSSGASPKSSK